MKTTRSQQVLSVFVLSAITILSHPFAEATPLNKIEVTQEKHNGWKVTAVGEVTIQNPAGKKTVLSEPFKTATTHWTPTAPIHCEWSADGMVAVFAHHPRVTDIYVFNTKTHKRLKETFPKKKMPAWYDNVAVVHDSPDGKWNGASLGISSKVTLRNKEQHLMKQTLEINGETFSLRLTPVTPEKISPAEAKSQTPDVALAEIDPVGEWTTRGRDPEFSLCLWESGEARGEFDSKGLAIHLEGNWHVIKDGKWKGYVIFSCKVDHWAVEQKDVTPKAENSEFLLSLEGNRLIYIKGGVLTDKNGGKFYPSGVKANDDPILHKQNSRRPIRQEPGNG